MEIANFIYLLTLFPNIWLVFTNFIKTDKITDLIKTLFHQRIIGKKHTPEKKLIKTKTQWLNKQEKKEFEKQYKLLLNEEIILRTKKQTKKGTDWHISLNPKKLKEIMELIK